MRSEEEQYNEEYYERGVSSGRSGYQDYRWMPEMTIKFAHNIIKELGLRDGDRVLDFGCAKGFLVKALRILDIDAYGCDISSYAIGEVDKRVSEYCSLMSDGKIPYQDSFRWTISKDVFEHLNEGQLEKSLIDIKEKSEKLFAIIPLGDGKKFIIPQYENDDTHILKQPREWWDKKFEDGGWRVDRFSHIVRGMKDNWSHYEKGNGFFFLHRNGK